MAKLSSEESFFTRAYDGVKQPPIKPQTKQPYAFTVSGAPTFAFAGLWDAWHDSKSDAFAELHSHHHHTK